jgi:hypothetical protein
MPAVFFQRKSAAEARLFYKFRRRGNRTRAFRAQRTQNNSFPKQTNCGKENRFWVFAARKGENVWSKKPAKWGICAKNGAKKARKGMTSLDEKTI